jgi:hypothetical protein
VTPSGREERTHAAFKLFVQLFKVYASMTLRRSCPWRGPPQPLDRATDASHPQTYETMGQSIAPVLMHCLQQEITPNASPGLAPCCQATTAGAVVNASVEPWHSTVLDIDACLQELTSPRDKVWAWRDATSSPATWCQWRRLRDIQDVAYAFTRIYGRSGFYYATAYPSILFL